MWIWLLVRALSNNFDYNLKIYENKLLSYYVASRCEGLFVDNNYLRAFS